MLLTIRNVHFLIFLIYQSVKTAESYHVVDEKITHLQTTGEK